MPKDFIHTLEQQYTADFLRQELLGEFVEHGGVVFREAFYYDELPAGPYREAIGADFAYTTKTRSDYSVAIRGRMYGSTLYITDFYRAQVETPYLRGRA